MIELLAVIEQNISASLYSPGLPRFARFTRSAKLARFARFARPARFARFARAARFARFAGPPQFRKVRPRPPMSARPARLADSS